ncbi:MAG: cell division protein FtsQ/DivIB [Steroidobacteraceae bacterium]
MIRRKRNNRRKADDVPSRWQLPQLPWRRIGVVCVAVAGLALGSWGLLRLLDQPVEQVSVRGHFQRVSALDVEKIVRSRLTGAGLLSIDLGALRNGLRALPWIDSATVERAWPRGLVVTVIEQNAVARWNENGLVNARGELFLKESRFLPPELPSLAGPVGTEAEVTARYLAAQGKLVEAGLRLTAMSRDERGAWEMTLDDGVTVRLGRRDVDARFARFLTAGATLVTQRAIDIDYVDMRYSNGFAVGWRGSATHLATDSAAGDEHPNG